MQCIICWWLIGLGVGGVAHCHRRICKGGRRGVWLLISYLLKVTVAGIYSYSYCSLCFSSSTCIYITSLFSSHIICVTSSPLSSIASCFHPHTAVQQLVRVLKTSVNCQLSLSTQTTYNISSHQHYHELILKHPPLPCCIRIGFGHRKQW